MKAGSFWMHERDFGSAGRLSYRLSPLNLRRFISASAWTESHYAAAAVLPKIKASRAASFKILRQLQRSE